ncbi:MAG TPA: hypothetical protein VGS19_27055 [Streptosporangiaceae bacterium]|nr:hypothetical protein [Streptosporangiaceae bacterium]
MPRLWTTLLSATAAATATTALVPASAGTRPLPDHAAGHPAPAWTIQASQNPASSHVAELSAVACGTPGDCWAVGDYETSTGQLTLAEHWNGRTWAIVATPNAPEAKDSLLSGVSCAGPSWCTAVGYQVITKPNYVVSHVLIEAWNGTRWAIQRSPGPSHNPSSVGLTSVSCTAPDSCTAVGGFTRTSLSAQSQPLAEHWNGSVWSIQPVPNPQAENGSELDGVSCTAGDACTAGGNYFYADIAASVFAERWDGTAWVMQQQPNSRGQDFNIDSAVSCTSTTVCVSAGLLTNGGNVSEPLAEAWNGTSWRLLHARDPRGSVGGASFSGLSCATSTSCVAVGDWSATTTGGLSDVTLAERWNGTAWAVQPTPNPTGAQSSSLASVYCPTARMCVAVGSSFAGTATQTLAEHYSG